jgi:hypothetical protein
MTTCDESILIEFYFHLQSNNNQCEGRTVPKTRVLHAIFTPEEDDVPHCVPS